MNERIQQLALEAGFSKDKYDLYWDEDANAEGVDLEKFAELIVRECADFVTEQATIETLLGKLLKEHFGVEE